MIKIALLTLIISSLVFSPIQAKEYIKVEVVWNDAFSIEGRSMTIQQVADYIKNKKYQQKNIGYVIYENEEYLVLAGMMHQSIKGEDVYDKLMLIPKSIIQETHQLSN